jgi:hypothetical protein
MFKKYNWFNADLQKKYKLYSYAMYGACALVLLCLYLLPQNLKMANLLILIIGMVLWWKSYQIKQQDMRLKIAASAKQAKPSA